jgi:uncharacterized protein with ParB-like and HNH nuclease domain
MTNTITVTPGTIFLEDFLVNIANGEYKVPIFQRNFVWKSSQMIELFDSILKGYPIGNLLFWQTDQEYKTKDKIGPYIISKNANQSVYVLDGFQRISTLFGVLTNPKKYGDETNINTKKYSIYFDLEENSFSYIRNKKNTYIPSVPLYEIYDNRELFNFARKLDKENIPETKKNKYIDNVRDLHSILHKYRLPFVLIKGGDIKAAVEIFSRVNSTGTDISEDFMLSALSYNDNTDFLLTDSITTFLNGLNPYNFQDLKRPIVLDCISNTDGKIYFDVTIEDLLKKEDLKDFVNTAYKHIQKAVEFLYKKLCVIDIRLLPYPAQLIFISEYFRLNPEPTSEQYEALKKWFWVTTYSNYFTMYSLSQQRSAYKIFCEFAKGEHPDGIFKVDNGMTFRTAKYPKRLNFMGVRPKALQLFYLKTILEDHEIQDREGFKEIFIFSALTKEKPPANIILRLSSEFEQDQQKKQPSDFIKNSAIEVLEKHFINEIMVELYKQNKQQRFLNTRKQYLVEKENKFVETMGINYVKDDMDNVQYIYFDD